MSYDLRIELPSRIFHIGRFDREFLNGSYGCRTKIKSSFKDDSTPSEIYTPLKITKDSRTIDALVITTDYSCPSQKVIMDLTAHHGSESLARSISYWLLVDFGAKVYADEDQRSFREDFLSSEHLNKLTSLLFGEGDNFTLFQQYSGGIKINEREALDVLKKITHPGLRGIICDTNFAMKMGVGNIKVPNPEFYNAKGFDSHYSGTIRFAEEMPFLGRLLSFSSHLFLETERFCYEYCPCPNNFYLFKKGVEKSAVEQMVDSLSARREQLIATARREERSESH